MLDENDNEIDERNIEDEERRFPTSIDKEDVVKEEKAKPEEKEDNVDEVIEEEFDELAEGQDIEESESL